MTSQPSLRSSTADRSPTAPRPSTAARLPARLRAFAIRAIVVAAVVLQPLESSITETRKGPKNAFCAALKTSSPVLTSLPPTQTAIVSRSSTPRVKKASCTSPRTASGFTSAWDSRTSTPASWATIASNGLGCSPVSSWSRTFFTMPPRSNRCRAEYGPPARGP